jgi:phosphate-selective porin OprO/OprP
MHASPRPIHRVLPVVPLIALAAGRPALAQDPPSTPPTIEQRLATLETQMSAPKPADDGMRVFWKDGLRMESADKRYKFRLGGRIHYDAGFFSPDDDTQAAVETGTTRIEDGSEFRRARIETSGEVADRVDWAASYDFAGSGAANFRNLYLGFKELPFGNLRFGQYKEPYGLEQQTSSNHITFIERSLMNSFVPAFNAGVMVFDNAAEERFTWAVGGFRTGTDNGEVSKGDGEYAVTARVTGLAMYRNEGKSLVHLGLSASRRSPTDDTLTFSAKPEANLAPAYVSVTVPAETLDLFGAETAWAHGRFSLQGEYTLASIDGPSGATSDPDFSGYYAQASYVLTGEGRAYNKANGCFGTVKPAHNALAEAGGKGAWEVAVRYSAIDLVDDGIDEGELTDVTAGLNWYVNPNTRFMLNVISADLEPTAPAADGQTEAVVLRAQFNF